MKEQEVLIRYGLPIFTSILENKEEIKNVYDEQIKKLGSVKAKLTRKINEMEDPSEKEKLRKQRQKLEIESEIESGMEDGNGRSI